MPAGERRAWTVRLPGRSPRARMSAENDVAESRWDTFALATKVPDPADEPAGSPRPARRSPGAASSWPPRAPGRAGALRAAGHRGPAPGSAAPAPRGSAAASRSPPPATVMDHWYSTPGQQSASRSLLLSRGGPMSRSPHEWDAKYAAAAGGPGSTLWSPGPNARSGCGARGDACRRARGQLHRRRGRRGPARRVAGSPRLKGLGRRLLPDRAGAGRAGGCLRGRRPWSTVCADVTEWEPAAPVDLVLCTYLHLPSAVTRPLLVRLGGRSAPGGRLVLLGHDLANLDGGVGGPQDADVLWHSAGRGSPPPTPVSTCSAPRGFAAPSPASPVRRWTCCRSLGAHDRNAPAWCRNCAGAVTLGGVKVTGK